MKHPSFLPPLYISKDLHTCIVLQGKSTMGHEVKT